MCLLTTINDPGNRLYRHPATGNRVDWSRTLTRVSCESCSWPSIAAARCTDDPEKVCLLTGGRSFLQPYMEQAAPMSLVRLVNGNGNVLTAVPSSTIPRVKDRVFVAPPTDSWNQLWHYNPTTGYIEW
ncbi:Aste57867_3889 [Aphanomyces stellatus]|uniref:Aste57867_3889 protein n=1 Tax=Aphanomyces stellatus TaxID=120398 RepID=A0A485KAJ7_9STRA|nr:hypothetical protein As57867_003878 [Aphanomyces stellatus]VFT81034.1 Aste57867_3889 [Aphanomyces stellatus]